MYNMVRIRESENYVDEVRNTILWDYESIFGLNPTGCGGGRSAPGLSFFAYPDKKIIDNL